MKGYDLIVVPSSTLSFSLSLPKDYGHINFVKGGSDSDQSQISVFAHVLHLYGNRNVYNP